MLELTSISIDEPFEQLFATAYLHRRQLSQCIFEGLLVGSIFTQYLCSLQRAGKGIEGNLIIHRTTSCDGG